AHSYTLVSDESDLWPQQHSQRRLPTVSLRESERDRGDHLLRPESPWGCPPFATSLQGLSPIIGLRTPQPYAWLVASACDNLRPIIAFGTRQLRSSSWPSVNSWALLINAALAACPLLAANRNSLGWREMT